MAIAWQAALRLYAKSKGHYIVPKKGTPEYEEIKKLQGETADGPEHAVKKRGPNRKKAVAEKPMPSGQKEMDLKAGVKGDVVMPPPAVTKEVDAPMARKKAKKVVEPLAEEVKEPSGVSKTGKTRKANAQEYIQNENTGPSAVITAQLPDQEKEIKKVLKRAKATPKVVTVGEGQEKTIDGMKTDDPKAIEGRAPFSIQALRNKLLC